MYEDEKKEPKPKSLTRRIRRKLKHTLGSFFINTYRTIRAQALIMNLLNRKSQRLFEETREPLSFIENKALQALNRDGIFITSIEELKDNGDDLREIRDFIDKEFEHADIGRSKKFLFYLWNNAPTLDLNNPIVRFGLSPQIIRIANEYLGLIARFTFYSVNKTIVRNAEAEGSQRWHRDPPLGDEKIFKVFLYLNDVDEKSGPFMFIKESQRTGRLGKVFGTKQPYGNYPPNDDVESHPELQKNIISLTGKAGTLVFCDTTGLHKGGYSREKERIMATWLYVSPASLERPNFSRPANFITQLEKLPEKNRQTLTS